MAGEALVKADVAEQLWKVCLKHLPPLQKIGNTVDLLVLENPYGPRWTKTTLK